MVWRNAFACQFALAHLITILAIAVAAATATRVENPYIRPSQCYVNAVLSGHSLRVEVGQVPCALRSLFGFIALDS